MHFLTFGNIKKCDPLCKIYFITASSSHCGSYFTVASPLGIVLFLQGDPQEGLIATCGPGGCVIFCMTCACDAKGNGK